MTLEEMRARRKELVDKSRNLRAIADEEKRELSEEEARNVDEWIGRAEHLTVEIDREERLCGLEENQTRSHRAPTKPDVDGNDTEQRPFGQPTRFRSFGEQMQKVIHAAQPGAVIDPRLTRSVTGANEGMASDGGFLVQTDFAAELLKRTYETGQVASRTLRLPISGKANGIKINSIDEINRATGSRWGGVRAYWAAEGGDYTASRPKFSQIELSLKKLTGLAYATEEMLEDSTALETILMQAFSEEFGFLLDDACINGDGSGKPQGILASPALVSVSAEAGQAAATLQPENIIKMWSRCYNKSRLNAIWFINQDIEPQLFTLGIAIGTAGSTVYMPPGGLSQAPYGTLFGRPIIPIEQCATLGTVGDIILADMSQYVLADKGGMKTASSIHVRFINDEQVFRFTYRVDGQPIWKSVLTPYKGTSNTVSPFVALATRS